MLRLLWSIQSREQLLVFGQSSVVERKGFLTDGKRLRQQLNRLVVFILFQLVVRQRGESIREAGMVGRAVAAFFVHCIAKQFLGFC